MIIKIRLMKMTIKNTTILKYFIIGERVLLKLVFNVPWVKNK